MLKTLTYREREIIRLRYGLGDGYTYTLEEVGRIFKVTRERVRQIEAKAVRKLQNPVRSKKLEGFVDLELLKQMAERAQARPPQSETPVSQPVEAIAESPTAEPSLFDPQWDESNAEPDSIPAFPAELVDDGFSRAA